LYLCDTNNHVVKKVNLETLQVHPLDFVETPSSVDFEAPDTGSQVHHVRVSCAGGKLELKIKVDIPKGVKINAEAPSSWTLKLPSKFIDLFAMALIYPTFILDDIWSLEHETLTGPVTSTEFSIHLKHKTAIAQQSDVLGLKLNIFLCHSDSGVCSVARRSLGIKATFQDLENPAQSTTIHLDAH